MLDLLKKHLANFSAAKWDDYKAALANDVTYEEAATQLRAKGPDEYVKLVQRWKRAFPDLKANVIRGFESGDKVVAELEWEGTHSGPLDGPFGTIQATNKRGRVKGVIIATIKNGKIASEHHYFDLLTVLNQIGVAPMAGAKAPAAEKPAVRH